MKLGIKTTEFWLTFITSISGLLVALGIVTPDQANAGNNAVAQIVGGVVALVALVQYIKGRSAVKVAAYASGVKDLN